MFSGVWIRTDGCWRFRLRFGIRSNRPSPDLHRGPQMFRSEPPLSTTCPVSKSNAPSVPPGEVEGGGGGVGSDQKRQSCSVWAGGGINSYL